VAILLGAGPPTAERPDRNQIQMKRGLAVPRAAFGVFGASPQALDAGTAGAW
jgi:hypothetical protein